MKTLLQSSSSSKLISGDNRGGFLSAKDHVLGRPDICFFKCQKHVNVGFISLQQQQQQQHKKKMMIIRPISSSSSLSSESQEELEAAETQTQEIHQSKTVHVKLQLQKECLFGESFLIVGDDPMFGLWDASDAIPLDWSEEHLWTVELDIPIGKLIQFKFILKGKTGNILWQPGPDRILRTWETINTITVLEDWENAEFQKIMEEGPIETKNEVSFVTSDMLIDDENFTLPKEEQMCVVHETSEKTSMETYNESVVTQNITQSPMLIVAENITYSKENNDTTRAKNIAGNNGKASALSNLTNSQNEKILDNNEGGPALVPGLAPLSALQTEEAPLYEEDKRITMESSSNLTNSRNEKILDNHERGSVLVPGLAPLSALQTEEAPLYEEDKRITMESSSNLTNSQNEKILDNHEGGSVLVPGLAPLPALQTEEAPLYEEDKRITMESSIGPVEAKNWNASEFNEQQEPVSDLHQEVVKLMFKGQELHSSELQQNPEVAGVKEQWRSDMQWGRGILQKLFTNLGFF